MPRIRARLLFLLTFVAALLATPSPAHARPLLVNAFPSPNQTLDRPPEQVRLTFDRPLDQESFTLTVVDAVGVLADEADAHIQPGDPSTLVVSLPPLEEGLYTVTYTVTDPVSQTSTGGNYQFFLDFPSPQIVIVQPPDGAGFELTPTDNSLTIEVDTGKFDLSYWKYSWRLYLDGKALITTRRPSLTLRNFDQGVHELSAILVDPDGVELFDTRSVIHFAIGEPDPEAEEIAIAARQPGDPGLILSREQGIGLALGLVLCLGAGIWIGRRAPEDAT